MAEEISHKDYTTKLKFRSFEKHQMGRGLVGFKAGKDVNPTLHHPDDIDPITLFIHDDAEKADDATLEQVAKDCKELVRLLDKFRIVSEMLNPNVVKCGID